MIYSVVPPELGDDVYERLVEHYKDNPKVMVIRERRKGERRKDSSAGGERRQRDRRRQRPGTFDL
jgi:hypothetical protein